MYSKDQVFSVRILLIFFVTQVFHLTNVQTISAQLSFDLGVSTGDDQELEALYRDLSSLVIFHERLDWISDEHSLTMMEGKLLEITCQVKPKHIKELSQLLHQEIDTRGEVKSRWQTALHKAKQGSGEPPDLDDYRNDLRTERILLALLRGHKLHERCPFWLTPKHKYLGIHRDAGRFQLVLESMSSLQIVRGQEGWIIKGSQIGGSGQGRLMLARGLSLKTAFALGIEIGGASTFPSNEEGKRELNGVLTGGIPMILRWWLGGLRFDTESSLLARFPEGQDTIFGFRVSQGVGISTLRVSGLLPHFMIWTGYERFFPSTEPQVSIIRLGTRVGFSWGAD